MTKFKRQLISVLATGAVFASMITPAFAVDIEIVNNGPDSNNTVNFTSNNTQTVAQNNTANINNNINSSASSGNNTADKNNANVTINTGDVQTNTTVNNVVNSNKAVLACCTNNDVTVNLDHNGPDSHNKATLNLNTNTSVLQNNAAYVNNSVNTTGDSGKNQANKNNGNTTILSGDVNVGVNVSTKANANIAKIGGNGENSGSVSILVKNNGPDSDNNVTLKVLKNNLVQQLNKADVNNYINATGNSGGNKADKNNGNVWLETHDANVKVGVDNLVNFNWASIDCGCLLDNVFAKLGNNGPDSKNKIKASLGGQTTALQNNYADLYNNVYAKAKTGDNKAKGNNGSGKVNDPVVISTGDASDWQTVHNKGNENFFGSGPITDWPWSDSNFNVNVTLDLAQLLALLHLSV